MQPLYYLPQLAVQQLAPQGKLSRAVLGERLLGDVWRDCEWEHLHRGQCQRGPDGQAGLILSAGEAKIGYLPEQQTWHCIEDGVLWIGLANGQPPTPLELMRRNVISGHVVELQGNNWHVPVIRRLDLTSNLPQVPRWVNGSCTLTIRQEWQSLWESSGRMWNVFAGEEYTLAEVLGMAVDVLAVNYRFDRHLQGVLEVLDTTNWEAVLRAAVDWPAVESFLEAQKKSSTQTEAGLANTTPGDEGEAPDTHPAEENCTLPPSTAVTGGEA